MNERPEEPLEDGLQEDVSGEEPRQPAPQPISELEALPVDGEAQSDRPKEPVTGAAETATQATPAEAAAVSAAESPVAAAAEPTAPTATDEAASPEAADEDAAVLAESRGHTRRAFVAAGVATAAAAGFAAWLNEGPRVEMQPWLLRRALQANAALSRSLGSNHAMAPEYPLSRAETLRVNGNFGVKKGLIAESWRLQMVGVHDADRMPEYVPDVTAWEYRYNSDEEPSSIGPALEGAALEDDNHTGRKPRGMEEAGESDSTLLPGTPGLLLTLDRLKQFPRRELVTQFKCIEGWSQVVHWAGVRLADVLEAYPPAPVRGREPRFVYMETPDGDYYTGYDLAVCRHPQTLLVTEMMGAPLTAPHGAPLRLHMPTKYGYKQIKRIGLIAYMQEKSDDYWTKLGYDWYAGL